MEEQKLLWSSEIRKQFMLYHRLKLPKDQMCIIGVFNDETESIVNELMKKDWGFVPSVSSLKHSVIANLGVIEYVIDKDAF